MNPIILILILIGVFNSISKAAKKQAQAAKADQKATPVPPHAARRVMKNIDPSVWKKVDEAAARQAEKREQQEEKKKPQAVPAFRSDEGSDPCHQDMLRGVKPQGWEEGADPCHEYMLSDSVLAGETDAETDAEQAQELLRGIVLSEILKRPRSVSGRRMP